MDGGPNGVHKQNRAKGASSVFLFWPFRTLSFPLMSNRCKEKKISMYIPTIKCLQNGSNDVIQYNSITNTNVLIVNFGFYFK